LYKIPPIATLFAATHQPLADPVNILENALTVVDEDVTRMVREIKAR